MKNLIYSCTFLVFLSSCDGNNLSPDCIDSTQIGTTLCPEIYQPVCGCDGVTYDNECAAEHHGGVTSFSQGECLDEPCINPDSVNEGQVCPIYWDPVCGCSGLTYDNECMADRAGERNWTPGACPE